MRATLILSAIVLIASMPGGRGTAWAEPGSRKLEVLSKTYTIDRKYRSMEGPESTQQLTLLATETPELLWIRGYRAVMVGPDGQTRMPQEFMCHSNLDFLDVSKHNELFKARKSLTSRLFTLSQGQFDIEFPKGFGIPVRSDEPFSLTTQVLNLNLEHPDAQVRHQVTIDFVRDQDLEAPLQPLFSSGAYGLELLEGQDGYFGVPQPKAEAHGPGCLVGTNASSHTYKDPAGKTFTGHWVVKPGREVNKTLVTHLMNLPFDTTIHYIAVHLHPFAESIALRDLTTGQTLYTSQATNFSDRIGLERVDAYSSPAGIPVFQNHEYELVSIYNNTTSENQDSMAVMYVYLEDREFLHPFRAQSVDMSQAQRPQL